MKSRYVLVTGATGPLGQVISEILLNSGHRVIAFCQDTEGIGADRLRSMGAEIDEGNYESISSLIKAASGVDTVFATAWPDDGNDAEVRKLKNIAYAAGQANVSHIIYRSVANADKKNDVPYFERKYEIESQIKSLGIPYTIVGPVFLMENLLTSWSVSDLKKGIIKMALFPDKKIKLVSTIDVGKFIALVIEEREPFLGKRIDVAADDLSGKEMALFLTTALGWRVYFVQQPQSELRSLDQTKLFEWLNKVGFQVNIDDLWKKYPEIGWSTFPKWVRVQNWNSILGPRI